MPEGIPISVDPDAINEYIAKQVVDSVLGERLQEVVDSTLKQLSSFGNDPLKNAVQSEINTQIMNLVRTEFAPQIAAAVREAMTTDFINNLAAGFVASITAQIDKRF